MIRRIERRAFRPYYQAMPSLVSQFADIRMDGCAYIVRTRRGTLVGRVYNTRDLSKLLDLWETEAKRRLRQIKLRTQEEKAKGRLDQAIWGPSA